MIFNVTFRLTDSGAKLYDYLFPPAIRIYSSPQGATVYLDDKLLKGKTPLNIPEISPGVHQLSLFYSGYPPVIKSINVPSRGAVKVAGEKARKGYEPYLFRFKTLLELRSDPDGTSVFLNDIKLPEKTRHQR